MQRFNHFLYGFIPGLFLPIAFSWIYLNQFYPGDYTFFETIKQLYPSVLFGKILLLSTMPNLMIVFLFYKSDSFKVAAGMLLGAMPYFIASIFLL